MNDSQVMIWVLCTALYIGLIFSLGHIDSKLTMMKNQLDRIETTTTEILYVRTEK